MTHGNALDLVLVVPVYNEEAAIVPVLQEWRAALKALDLGFGILVIDDGSTDTTPRKLDSLDWPELRVHRHSNRGHGQSCLVGYRLAHAWGAQRVFQIDSDGQCEPASFNAVWQARDSAPAIYGRRLTRGDGPARLLISSVLRWFLKAQTGTRLNDSNVPYRLYDAALAAEAANRVPTSFDLANIAMALLLEPQGYTEVPIHFRDRQGGHPSVRWSGFAKKALRLRRDLRALKNAGIL